MEQSYNIETSVQGIENIKNSLNHYLPEIILVGLMMLILLLHLVFRHKKIHHQVLVISSIVGLLVVATVLLYKMYPNMPAYVPTNSHPTFLGLLHTDKSFAFFRLLIVTSGILTILISLSSTVFEKKIKGEYYFLVLAMVLGLDLILLSKNLLILYLSIELVSITSYIITVFYFNKKSAEAGIKYLLFGAMASAIMLYGISFLYGISGTLQIETFPNDKLQDYNFIFLILFLGGLFFKLSLFPFHFWTPDIYEASPTPIVAFFSIAPKAAVWVVLYIFLLFYNHHNDPNLILPLSYFIMFSVFMTLLVGNFSALWQKNIKRLFAYSAIAQIGFIGIALFSRSEKTFSFAFFYFLVYMIAIVGLFLIIDIVAKQVKKQNTDIYLIEYYKGLGQKYPFLGVTVLIFMLVLVGLPPTSGFLAKVFVFSTVWETYTTTQNFALLALFLFALFMTVISLFYYLKIPFLMFFRKPENDEILDIKLNPREYIIIIMLAFLSLLLFFAPQIILQYL